MDKFNDVIKHLDPQKLYQISMDGPSVHIKFLNKFKVKREENAFHSIIDIGSCSLHTVHGSVKTAFDKSNMKIKETLKGGFQFDSNSPARHKDYESVSGSTTYRLYYCAIRWVENKLVAKRMFEVWPNLKKLINFWISLPKSKQLKCKSHKNVCDAMQDPFMISKLTFFSFVCELVESYSKEFQSDHPMVSFIYSEVKSVIKSLHLLIVKPCIIGKSNTAIHLKNIDLSREGNLLLIKDVEMGFRNKKVPNELIKKDNVSA